MDNDISIEKIQHFVVSHPLIVIFIIGSLILTIIQISQRAKIATVIFKVQSPTNYEDNSVKNCLIQSKYLDQNCHWYFLKYTPSAWESSWANNIENLQNVVCETLADRNNLNKSVAAVERLMELQKFGRNHSESNKQSSDVLLSRMFYQKECIDPITNVTSKGVIVSQLIEPLIGLLRDPLTICNRIGILPASAYEGAVTQSKRF
ncbi:unnamed protein product, partial [Adineta steineri]